jgi:acetyl-CoA carboxylase biotin carboxyl carrier protein
VAHDSGSPVARRPQDRLDDHAAIDRLTDELLPALVAKLGANGLGELEVREGSWRVRLRMPADGHAAGARRSPSGRQGARAADGSRGEHSRTDAAGTAGSGHATAASGHAPEDATAAGPSRVVATSPAVGYFRPRADLRAGTKVRAGDRIGSVDVLGIGQDLVAPGDGLIGATLVEAGEPVEYGQAVIVLEQLAEPRPHAASATAAQSGPAESGPAAAGPAAAAPAGHDGAPATGVA